MYQGTRLVDRRSKTACPEQYSVQVCSVYCIVSLASTSVLVVGNMDMVEFLVTKDSIFHFIVCGLGTACRGSDTISVPQPEVYIKWLWKDQRRVDLV